MSGSVRHRSTRTVPSHPGARLNSAGGRSATGQEVRLAYAGLIGWLSGLFQGLQAAMQFQQIQANLALQGGDSFPSQPDRSSQDAMGRTPEHATGQYL